MVESALLVRCRQATGGRRPRDLRDQPALWSARLVPEARRDPISNALLKVVDAAFVHSRDEITLPMQIPRAPARGVRRARAHAAVPPGPRPCCPPQILWSSPWRAWRRLVPVGHASHPRPDTRHATKLPVHFGSRERNGSRASCRRRGGYKSVLRGAGVTPTSAAAPVQPSDGDAAPAAARLACACAVPLLLRSLPARG